jgi:hypothetical protein
MLLNTVMKQTRNDGFHMNRATDDEWRV